jgi:benzylsuccinate CoA-transferase BbsF subunit
MSPPPLEGIKVADFTRFIAGPLVTKVLAGYGAQVVRIEGVGKIDGSRLSSPFKDHIQGGNRAGQFNQDNTGKLSVAINLTTPQGLEVAKKFVAWADIVVENFAGGSMERMGLGYEVLKKIRPDIIMLSSCMQGQTGPHYRHPGFGPHLAALSGFKYLTGWPDRRPMNLGPYTDFVAPLFSVTAILAALAYRRRTGKGQYIDMAQFENAVQFMSPHLLDYQVNGRIAERKGNHYPYAAPHNAYRCLGEDRWCAIAVFTEEQWPSFCKAIGDPAWSKKEKFATFMGRKENEDELDGLVEEWTCRQTAEDVMLILQKAGVAAGVLETARDLLENDAQLKHRRFFEPLDHPEIGKYYGYRSSFILSKAPYRLKRAPLLGEHNDYALKTFLGLTDDEISQLVIDGVLEFP